MLTLPLRTTPPRTAARPRDEDGAVAIMVGLMATVLFVVAALVVDLGQARDTRRQAQNAADASALAAANVLFPSTGVCQTTPTDPPPCFEDAIAQAQSYAQSNYGVLPGAWATCTDAAALGHTPGSDCISFDSATSPTQVRVLVPTRKVATGLGAVSGVSSVSVNASAVASVQTTPGDPYAVFAISTTCGPKTLEINGNSFLITGGVHSNASGQIRGRDITINGKLHFVEPGSVDNDVVTTSRTTGPPVRPDPLNPFGTGERIELWRPGSARALALGSALYHNMGNTLVTRSTVQTLGAGVYYTTKGVDLSGGPLLSNVTFVIDRELGDKVFVANGSNVAISHFVDPVHNPNEIQVITNAAGGDATTVCDKPVVHINGSDFSYRGAIYAPRGHVHLNGNDHQSTDGSIIAASLKINGNDAGVSNDGDLSIGGADVGLLR